MLLPFSFSFSEQAVGILSVNILFFRMRCRFDRARLASMAQQRRVHRLHSPRDPGSFSVIHDWCISSTIYAYLCPNLLVAW